MGYDKNHKLYSHLHICLVEDHYNPLGIVRSLGEAGIEPIILLCTLKPKLVNYSRYAKKIHMFDSIESAYLYMVSNYSNQNNKPFVYNGSDNITLFLDEHYEEIKDSFYFFNGKGNIRKYLQKYEITKLALECGCDIPKQELLKTGDIPKELSYPVITKAVTSSNGGDWKAETYICDTEEDLEKSYLKIESDYILVQEYIKKKNEYCIDGISINGGEEIFLPYAAQYFRFSPKSYGAYMYFEKVINQELINKIHSIIKKSKYTGVFCIEFLIGEDNNLYFLEVNYRNSGWSYAFTYGGYNLLYNWAKSIIDGEIKNKELCLVDRNFTAMSEFEDYQIFVKEMGKSFYEWFKDFRSVECTFIYNKKDPIPFYIIIFRRSVNKIIRVFMHLFGRKWKGY